MLTGKQSGMQRKIGLFGGTFDPVHLGHLAAVDDVLERTGCDLLSLVPCRVSPLKDAPGAAPEDRCAMLESALGERPRTRVDRRELEREGASYTIDTLAAIRAEAGPEVALGWVLGSDALAGLDRWQRWEELPELAHLLLLDRPGAPLPETGPVAELVADRWLDDPVGLRARPAGGIWPVHQRPVDVSATQVRDALAQGPDGWQLATRLLPPEVWEYIRRRGLYGVVPARPR
jgi:nicotinate-nucleotide adenylyltransferase